MNFYLRMPVVTQVYILSFKCACCHQSVHIVTSMCILIPRCKGVVVPSHVKKYLVFLDVLGVLNTTQNITVCSCMSDKSTELCPLPGLAIAWSEPPGIFLWGFVKYDIYVPPVPITMNNFKDSVRRTNAKTDRPLLRKIWHDVKYSFDACGAANEAYIELAKCMEKFVCCCLVWYAFNFPREIFSHQQTYISDHIIFNHCVFQ
jgi:hypothetical protein